jgi:hypothetical protein
MWATQVNHIKDPAKLPPGSFTTPKHCVFILCNTYTNPKYELGPGPLNDSVTVASNLHLYGYDTVFLHNPSPILFKYWLKFIFANVEGSLVLFYTGHGASVTDRSGDEVDGRDEVMVFDNSYILDDELASLLKIYRLPLMRRNPEARTILISDCCHSGTIWDIPDDPDKLAKFPKGVLGISAALDDQTAKQTSMDKRDQGLFSYYFWKFWREDKQITPTAIAAKMHPFLAQYSQQVVISVTSPELTDQPIFPKPPADADTPQ